MNINKLLATALILPNFLWAHGSTAKQSSFAIDKAVELFSEKPKEVQSEFYSVTATLTGLERFTVSLLMKNKTTQFNYDCTEDESVAPVIWECQPL